MENKKVAFECLVKDISFPGVSWDQKLNQQLICFAVFL